MSKNTSPVTTIISRQVKTGCVQDFEIWSKKVYSKVSEYDGFQNVMVIRPSDPDNLEYVIIVQWRDYASLKRWQNSEDLKKLLKESKDFTLSVKTLQEESGMNIWFDWPNNAKHLSKPPFYKQTIIAIMVVLPLIFVVGTITRPLLSYFELSLEIQIVINVLIISPLITLVMPQVTKLLHGWLYKDNLETEK